MKPGLDHSIYRGRIAPSPTGFLHLGHARTFWTARLRARAAGGRLILRNEDLDRSRCRAEFVEGMMEDLRWFGFEWQEGPDKGGERGPYQQSERMAIYAAVWERLREGGFIYPCRCSRKELRQALRAPHEEEPVYPGTCRPRERGISPVARAGVNWRFRIPDGEPVSFRDGNCGEQCFLAGKDFGDFLVWRMDDVPSYQLAVVADDAAMGITEVVRGMDLLVSTARQILLYRALGLEIPKFYHCALVVDAAGNRLAKRNAAYTLRNLRMDGATPADLRAGWR
jgi:glutamyl/glutaminyl-tRNA synthetase